MAEATMKDHKHHVAPDAARRRGLRSVPLYYAMAKQGDNGPRLLYVRFGFDEEALVLFSSCRAAQNYFFSSVFGGEWHPRACSPGELVSLLLGPYEGIEWILRDPLPGYLEVGGAQANLTSREHFVDQLLGNRGPVSST